ncbi:stonustoxin subunit beta-like [Symphorus nematophorus]
MASDHMQVAALGRPFTLGMLYDARRDELIPGLTLWDEKTLQANTVEEHHGSSDSHISASDTIESKSSLLDINASLKASFMGGLIEVGGSAKYLNDTKKFKNQSRVTFEYKATTTFKQLSMINLDTMDTQQKEVIEKGVATHVVTGILYGANAFFVFDSEKLEASSVQDIQGSMEAVIKKIPSFDVEGKVEIKLNEEEKELINKFSCKFYGDLLLDSNPATFVEAVKTYVQLPKLLKNHPEKESVPVKVWLMPLKNLDLKAPEQKTEISTGLVMKMQDALEDLKEIQMRCDDSLYDKVLKNFPQIKDELSCFKTLCKSYASDLKQTMAKALPLIREGKEDESKLEKLLEDRDKSPFSQEKLSEWLDHKEREINVIRSCVEMMEGTKIVPDQSELDREVLAAGVDDALCFVFTSLETADPCLQELKHYVGQLKPQVTADVTQPTKEPWYYSGQVFTNMREKAKAFHKVAKALKNNSRFRFLVAAIANEKYKGATIYHYRNGILQTEDFEKPDIPEPKTVRDRRDLIWYACDLTLDPDTANNKFTLSDGDKKATFGAPQSYPDLPQRFDPRPQVLCREGLTGRCYWEVEWRAGSPQNVTVAEMESEHMKVAALGRPFTLGMFYDARKDELIPGLTLWDNKTLQEHTVKTNHHSSAFEISASDTIESKSSLLDIEASLKASFMSGLIEVGGSAKYLKDAKKFKNQSRVTFEYKATTTFKQLSMINLVTMDTQQKEVIEKGLATHVVTGIEYGANAVFVFDSEKLEASSVQDIQGKIEAVIKKIPSFNVEGKVEIHLTEEEKELVNKFSCKFYGDHLLDSNPATFVEAVTTYVKLPKLLGENGENSVPVKVWLMPLKKLDPKAAELKKEISVGLVIKMQDALEDLKEIRMRCDDSLFDRVVEHFPQIGKDLSGFQNLCNHYTAKLQQTMAVKLPLIREGKEDESSVEKLFEDRDKSPFSHEKLSEWLDRKERKINVIRSCVEMMEGTKIVPDQSELDREVLAAGVDDALCFVFTSLETADPCLDAMTNYLDSLKLGSANEDPWYYSDEVLTKMREKAKAFHDVAKALKNNSKFRFLVAAIANEKHKGATIYRYRNGILQTDDFSKPDIPDVKTVTDRRDLIWYACDLSLDPDTAHNRLTLSEGNKKATCGAQQSYPDRPQRFDYYQQVLCREGLTGRCYWEVEWSAGHSEDVAVGVCYIRLGRKGKGGQCWLGGNTMSWALGHRWSPPEPTLYADHNNQQQGFPVPPTGITRLGVYLDWAAGTLSYYNASSDTLSHIHTFRAEFTEPVYPGFLIWRDSNYAHLSL